MSSASASASGSTAASRSSSSTGTQPRIGPMLAASANLGLMYAERLLADVSPPSFGRFARPGGVAVASNHPAFVLGHLSLYPSRAMAALGLPAGVTAVPGSYTELFKAGAECRDDVEGTIYPPAAELRERFFTAYRAAADATASAPDETLLRPNPSEGRLRELFPTVGSALGFYLGGHMQNHLGQLSAWRRMMGLPPAT